MGLLCGIEVSPLRFATVETTVGLLCGIEVSPLRSRRRGLGMRFSPLIFNLFKVPLIGLCLVLAFVVGRWGLADHYGEAAYQTIISWGATVPALADWEQATAPLQKAIALDPGNPRYNQRMGRLSDLHRAVLNDDQMAWGNRAKDEFNASLVVRPRWPLAWANLALVKASLGEFDGELNQAVDHAVKYGPWEPGVQQIIASVGSAGLGRFPRSIRDEIVANDVRGALSPVRGAPDDVLAMLFKYPVEDLRVVLSSIGRAMLANEWDDGHRRNFVRFTLQYWMFYPAEQQHALLGRLVSVAGDWGVLNQVRRYKKLDLVCPELASSRIVDQFCGKRLETLRKN